MTEKGDFGTNHLSSSTFEHKKAGRMGARRRIQVGREDDVRVLERRSPQNVNNFRLFLPIKRLRAIFL
jgi:hypothetical protein